MYRGRVVLLESHEKGLIILVLASLSLGLVDTEEKARNKLASSDRTVGGSCCGSNYRIRQSDTRSDSTSRTSHKNTPTALVLQRNQRAELNSLGRLVDNDHLKIKLL